MAAQLPAGGLGKLAGEGCMGPPPAAGASGPVGHPGAVCLAGTRAGAQCIHTRV